MTSYVYARTLLAAAVLIAGCSAEIPNNQVPNSAATSIEQAKESPITERSIAPELTALKITANAIEPGQDLEAFVKAWEAVRDKAINYWLTSNRAEKNDRLVNSFNSLATTAHSLGKPVLALEHIEAALKIVSENEGFEQYEPYLIYNRANFLTSAGLHDEAFKASREGIRRMAELGQTNHVINGFLLTSLATQLHHHGRYEEAIETSKASVTVLQELYGPKSPRVYQVQTVLLGLLIKQGDYEKAISLADSLMPILEKSDGKETRNYLFFLMGKRRAEFLQEPSAKLEGRYSLMDSPNLEDVRVIEALSGLLALKSGEASGLPEPEFA